MFLRRKTTKLKKEVRTWARKAADAERVAGPARTRANPREKVAITTPRKASNLGDAVNVTRIESAQLLATSPLFLYALSGQHKSFLRTYGCGRKILSREHL